MNFIIREGDEFGKHIWKSLEHDVEYPNKQKKACVEW